MAIPNMDDLEPIEIDALELVPYTTNVKIFKSTPAVELPTKLNAVADDFKTWNNNEIGTKGQSYLNTSVTSLTDYINTSMGTVVDFINNVVVDNQNTFETNITDQQNTFETNITDQQNTFETNITTNIGNYLDTHGAGYSISQTNSLEFTGNTTTEYDAQGRVVRFVSGAKETKNIAYNSQGNITSFTEVITVDGVNYTKNYTVAYDENGNPTISEVTE